MYNLQSKIKEQKSQANTNTENGTGRPSIRDKLLTQEMADLTSHIPAGCTLAFPDPDFIHEMELHISPAGGYWKDGTFVFRISVPLEYNIHPPAVCCNTKLWHPNIDTHGRVCLSILRARTIDGSGWAPTRTIKDIVWGLNSLFDDLLNFDDPLNVEAAEQYAQNKAEFERKVKHWVNLYARY